ncbi:MAG TPA: A/G-specific adenine glycosylase [Thermoanaerobaculia bacterium]|jgi:A/G-specific adenine glycosylase|nr:A/G-specific adenine glycosylase [Thermoanaerobaculia bacterium]
MRHAQDLLSWFDLHRRDLPWRRTSDPYKIWLSEVMLQQTRVETVLPFYNRFLERFPTVEDLARAEIEEVLTLWSGLGYYRRARQLHAAARRIAIAIAETGEFPSTVEGLLDLPGIGAYTAAAVASIAFGVAAPVMDGNVERVLSRCLALEEDPRSGPARKKLLAAAAALLDPGRPGDSNQALMELGATLCSPRRPKCLLCPLRSGCRAALEGDPERYPIPKAKREGERHRLLVAVVEDRDSGGVLLFRRPEDSTLLAGTWELPWVTLEVDGVARTDSPEAALASRYGGRWTVGERVGRARHGITYRDLEIDVHRAELAWGGEVREGNPAITAGWFDEAGRANLPLSSLVGKVLEAVATPEAAAPARRSRSRRR